MAETLNEALSANWKEEPPEINTDEFKKVIVSRRSVRVFTSDPIPEEVTQECLDMALLAPNSSNLQPWEFYWARSDKIKSKVIDCCLSQPAAKTARELIICVARTKTWPDVNKEMVSQLFGPESKVPPAVRTYYEKIIPYLLSQGPFDIFGFLKSIHFWFRGLKIPTPREPTSEMDMQLWAQKSCSLACENLMLAFRAFNFDSCPLEGFDSSRLSKVLELPSDATIVMVVAAGKRAENGVYGPRLRASRNRFIKII